MTTISSTSSSTATPTPTPSTTDATKTAAQALFNSLQTGSGIDLSSLVPSLVQAQFAARTAALKAKASTLTAQISATSTVMSSITDFASSLASLAKGGTLATQATSSNSGVLSVTTQSGAKLAGLSKSITVTALATAQTNVTNTSYDRTAAMGTGKLTIKVGSNTAVDINFPDGTSPTLDDIASKVNAAKTGVTASVISDVNGKAYLSFSGPTGAANSFTVTASEGATPGLSNFAVGNGATSTRSAATAGNAQMTVDGVSVQRATNSFSDLIPGVAMTLNAVSTAPVSLTGTRPTAALTSVVSDFVLTYNDKMVELNKTLDPQTGDLRSSVAARSLQQSLARLTTSKIVPGDSSTPGPKTLADLGVGTNRDGTLKVDSARLSQVMAQYPDAVEQMFQSSGDNLIGLSAQLNNIQMAATSTVYGLGATSKQLAQDQSANQLAQSNLTDDQTSTQDRMTAQFAAMNARVSSYKSVQSFLTQQVNMWTKSSN
ncbi:flagellar filament capping protein FliD [Sphingomonas sp. CFBP8993]|uniref:flagellar filament capping protein FliD n=1 Tax=Sphingomonas sp. CFBP8993 TaxID=3096526 RepID=UPI002A6A15F9|nr:flagellar filament capping protein FliD [Sphingomonas sp. CFBP8993]MDY0959410.1 flagellar filament capping protein FliD [Sphingomonas sp. CFBP8993]